MRTATNRLHGINRATADVSAGASSMNECINMRYKDEALRAVGQKKVVLDNFSYKDCIMHNNRLIAIYSTIDDTYVDYINSASGTLIQRIKGDLSNDIALHTIGNTLVIIDKIQNQIFTFTFNNNLYEKQFDGFPFFTEIERAFPISRVHTKDVESSAFTPTLSNPATDLEKKQFVDNLYSSLSEIKNKEAEFDEGFVLISTSYTLIDNTEVKCSNPIMFELGTTPILADNSLNELPTPFYTHTNGGCCAKLNLGSLYIKLPNIETLLSSYKHLIKSVNIYASVPISHYSTEKYSINTDLYFNLSIQHPIDRYQLITINANKLKKELFERTLMFRQCSITLADKDKLNKEFALKFDSEQTTYSTMPVENSSMFFTAGSGMVYNNRLHLHNYKRKFIQDANIFTRMSATTTVPLGITSIGSVYRRDGVTAYEVTISELRDCYMKIYVKTSTKDLIIVGTCRANFIKYNNVYYLNLQRFIAFPDSRAYKVEIYTDYNNVKYKGIINLFTSLAYNYSYFINNEYTSAGLSCTLEETTEEVDITNIYSLSDTSYVENDIVLVSAQNNAFFFPIEHSYRMPGIIKDITLQGFQIADSATGRYPLYAMTDKGIYALEQGDGKILYSNITHINSDTSEKTTRTNIGIAYITEDKRIMLLIGRDSVCISDQLRGNPAGKIRNTQQYPLTCNNPLLYEIQPYLSSISIETYIDNAALLYDRNLREIIISNINYKYSYVYSIENKAWHKITSRFLRVSDNDYSLIIYDDRHSLVKLDQEVNATTIVHIETRPINFDSSGFKSLQRMYLRGYFNVENTKIFGCYLYASNDNVNYEMINLTQIQGESSNILLNKCLNSYRYYILQVGGKVDECVMSHIDAMLEDKSLINIR